MNFKHKYFFSFSHSIPYFITMASNILTVIAHLVGICPKLDASVLNVAEMLKFFSLPQQSMVQIVNEFHCYWEEFYTPAKINSNSQTFKAPQYVGITFVIKFNNNLTTSKLAFKPNHFTAK